MRCRRARLTPSRVDVGVGRGVLRAWLEPPVEEVVEIRPAPVTRESQSQPDSGNTSPAEAPVPTGVSDPKNGAEALPAAALGTAQDKPQTGDGPDEPVVAGGDSEETIKPLDAWKGDLEQQAKKQEKETDMEDTQDTDTATGENDSFGGDL